jgi:hypothetical protein
MVFYIKNITLLTPRTIENIGLKDSYIFKTVAKSDFKISMGEEALPIYHNIKPLENSVKHQHSYKKN